MPDCTKARRQIPHCRFLGFAEVSPGFTLIKQIRPSVLEVGMSVSITFEPSGISGVVAQGTYLIDAARRMGAPLGAGCTAGKGECPACVVSVKAGADLLSSPSLVEEKQLGDGTVGPVAPARLSGKDRKSRRRSGDGCGAPAKSTRY